MPELAALVVADPPETWEAAGFSVVDGVAAVGGVAVRLGGGGPTRWAWRGVAVSDLDGIPTEATDDQPVAGDHPNGVIALDHVVVMTPDLDRTIESFAVAGLEPRRTREAGGGMLQVFFRAGPTILEVVGPGEARGDEPASIWGLTFSVADLDATAALLGDALGPVKDAVQPGRRIATLRHEAVGITIAVAFMTPR